MLLERVAKFLGKSEAANDTPARSVLCNPARHMRDASTVLHTGGALHAPCTRCGCVLTRKHNGWRPALPLRAWSANEYVDFRAAA